MGEETGDIAPPAWRDLLFGNIRIRVAGRSCLVEAHRPSDFDKALSNHLRVSGGAFFSSEKLLEARGKREDQGGGIMKMGRLAGRQSDDRRRGAMVWGAREFLFAAVLLVRETRLSLLG